MILLRDQCPWWRHVVFSVKWALTGQIRICCEAAVTVSLGPDTGSSRIFRSKLHQANGVMDSELRCNEVARLIQRKEGPQQVESRGCGAGRAGDERVYLNTGHSRVANVAAVIVTSTSWSSATPALRPQQICLQDDWCFDNAYDSTQHVAFLCWRVSRLPLV
jgi:hypothetical protein